MLKGWVYSAVAGLLIAVVGLAADRSMIAAMATSAPLGSVIYSLRFVAVPGIMTAVILTGLVAGNLHAGGKSYEAYLLVAFITNWALYGCLIHFLFTHVPRHRR